MLYDTNANLPNKKKKSKSHKKNGDRRGIYQELKLYVINFQLLKQVVVKLF